MFFRIVQPLCKLLCQFVAGRNQGEHSAWRIDRWRLPANRQLFFAKHAPIRTEQSGLDMHLSPAALRVDKDMNECLQIDA